MSLLTVLQTINSKEMKSKPWISRIYQLETIRRISQHQTTDLSMVVVTKKQYLNHLKQSVRFKWIAEFCWIETFQQ